MTCAGHWQKAAQTKALKRKKGQRTDPFSLIFMLPVGLADVIAQTLLRFAGGVNSNLGDCTGNKNVKKPRLFKGAASLTGRKSHAGANPRPDKFRLA